MKNARAMAGIAGGEPAAQLFFSSFLASSFLADFLVDDFLVFFSAFFSVLVSILPSALAPDAPAIGAPTCEAAKAVETANREATRVASSLLMENPFEVVAG